MDKCIAGFSLFHELHTQKPKTHTYLEFHGADPVEDFSHVLPDHCPGDLVVALSCGLHRVPCHVVERDHVGENANRLIEWTEPAEITEIRCKLSIIRFEHFQTIKPFRYNMDIIISFSKMSNLKCLRSWMLPVIRSVTILLQEVVFDQFGHLQGDFICFCQWCLFKW